jgi:hypothetical protein
MNGCGRSLHFSLLRSENGATIFLSRAAPDHKDKGPGLGTPRKGINLMPMHDWTRVSAGTFHDFHYSWVLEIKRALKRGLLPEGYYVMAEQQRTLVIRHTSNDRIVAMIEVLSPGNKSTRHAIRAFLDKTIAALDGGVHLLLVDVHPPGPRDPNGIYGAIMNEIGTEDYALGGERPLTAVAYTAGEVVGAFATHFAVGEAVPEMPLFLTRENYVLAPLEAAYMAAWEDVPSQYQELLGRR